MIDAIKRLLKEPFLHFLALGGVLFAIYAVFGPPGDAAPAPRAIIVDAARIDRLAARFEADRRRPPTDEELDALIEEHLREEVLYREALALGLDRDDPVIRRRLRGKMERIAAAGADLRAPDDAELTAWLTAHPDDYALAERISFRQILLGEAPTAAEIAAARSALAAAPDAWRDLGKPSLAPASVTLESRRQVDALFGPGFFERLAAAAPGEWAGPLRSVHGAHLAIVDEVAPGRAARLDEVRDAVLRDWRAARAEEMRKAQYEALAARYRIVVEGRER